MFRGYSRKLLCAAPAGAMQIVECPRDAMQGLKDFVPTEKKIRFINALLRVGFHTIDFGSFVSAPAVPQMRDTPEVLKGLDLTNTKSKLLAIIANRKGAERAAAEGRVNYIGFPLSASETFQRKNTNKTIEAAVADIGDLINVCNGAGKEFVTYISMGFGNPYGEEYSPAIVSDLVQKVVDAGGRIISLSDTVGVGEPALITELFTTLIPKYPHVQFGAHFHSGAVTAEEKVMAAYKAGVRRLDGALGGMGGCPFAKSTLVGNISTETIVDTLTQLGVAHNLDLAALEECKRIKHEVFGVGVKELILARVLNDELAFTDLCLRQFRHHSGGGGSLNRQQFGNALREAYTELGETQPSEEKLDASFKRIDVSVDGKITFEEYMMGARRGLQKRLERAMVQ